jgi:PAS domain S-box-containing protein
MLRPLSSPGLERPRLSHTDLPDAVVRLVGRFYFGIASVVALLAALAFALPAAGLADGPRNTFVAALALYAAACAWAFRQTPNARFRLESALLAAALAAMLLVGIGSALHHEGLRSPALGFGGLMVCLIGAIASLRYSLALAAFCLVEVAVMAWAQYTGLIQVAGPADPLEPALWLIVLLAAGVAGGALVSRVLDHYLLAAAERERRFRALLAIAADWYWELDAGFRFTRMAESNEAAGTRSPSRYLGRTPWELTTLGLSDEAMDAHRADLEEHRAFHELMIRHVGRRGQTRYVNISGAPRFDTAGIFLGYWGVGRDVTEEVQARQAVTASEMRYRELFARSPSPLLLHRRGLVVDANQAAANMLGYRDPQAIRGAGLIEHFAPGAARQQARERLARSEQLDIGQALPVSEYAMHALDGRHLTVQATGVCVATEAGPAVLAIFFDITARKATEAALRRSEALLSHLIATSPDCLTLTDLDSGRYTLVNDCFLSVTGHTRAEVVGRSASELQIWHDTAERDRLVQQITEHGQVQAMAVAFRHRQGHRIPMQVSAARFDFEGRRFLVMAARDVSASEQARLETEAILNSIPLAMSFVRGLRIVRTNPHHQRMFGWSVDEVNERGLSVLWPDEGQFAAFQKAAMAQLVEHHAYECEAELRRRDGSLFWCRLQGQSVDPSDPVGGGTIWSGEDITERRQFQHTLAAARDAAEAANRAKSAFLANTSHEIRTPLNGLLGLARLAMQPDLPEARRQQYLHQIFDSTQSLAGIISDILDLSKIEAGKITLEELPFGLRDTLAAVHHAYLALAEVKGLELVLSIDDSVPVTVRGDPLRVRQILSNFVTNALKFTERGRVRIEASAHAGLVRLAVHDTGPGIDAVTQQRLFTPFSQADESTTRRYGGTGLGLSICRELAQLMGGSVGVRSAPGEGSMFWAEVPLPASAPAEAAEASDSEVTDALRGAHVLMAEDNPVNMLIVVAMLEQWGMRVTQAVDGAMAVEAVLAAAQGPDPVDLVLMDVHMPVMSGHAAVRKLRERFDADALPVVALTAAALVSERDEALAAGMNDFLTKPIDARRLRRTLARYLRRATTVA